MKRTGGCYLELVLLFLKWIDGWMEETVFFNSQWAATREAEEINLLPSMVQIDPLCVCVGSDHGDLSHASTVGAAEGQSRISQTVSETQTLCVCVTV